MESSGFDKIFTQMSNASLALYAAILLKTGL